MAHSFKKDSLDSLFENGILWRAASEQFSGEQSSVLPGEQSSTFPGEQSSTFPCEQSSTFSCEQSSTLPSEQSSTLPSEQSSVFSCEQSSTLPCEQSSTPNERLVRDNVARRCGERCCFFGVDEIDRALPGCGLPFGAVHEFLSAPDKKSRLRFAPIFLVSYLLSSALSEERSFQKYIFWIGADCWPSPFVLQQCFPDHLLQTVTDYSVFLRPQSEKQVLSSIDVVLRSEASLAVIASVAKLSLAQSKRFSLLAKRSKALSLFLLPLEHRHQMTASHSRWFLQPSALPLPAPTLTWELTLLKIKGAQPQKRNWIIGMNLFGKNDDETFSLRLSSDLVDRPVSTEEEHARQIA